MPIYEYECIPNHHRFEVMQKMADEPLTKCIECGEPVRKLVSAAGFSFKGGGWYKDGYASVNKSSTSSESSSNSESKKTETPAKKETTTTPTTKESKS